MQEYIQSACAGLVTGATTSLLEVLLAARRPLLAVELAQALGLSAPGTQLHNDTAAKVQLLTNQLGPLVIWDEDHRCTWANSWCTLHSCMSIALLHEHCTTL